MVAVFTDSTTATIGATVAGSGANNVLAGCVSGVNPTGRRRNLKKVRLAWLKPY
jgi:hypothetical protein